jgi:hypothetical protein
VLDTTALGRQSVAALDAILEDAWPRASIVRNVVDAAVRFSAKGGSWKPTPTERIEISKIMLGEWACAVLGAKPR